MAVRIGNRQVVYSSSIIIPKGESALLDFFVGNWNLVFDIAFATDSSVDGAALSVEERNGKSYIKFTNWDNVLGTANGEPFVIGKTDKGSPLSILTAHWLVGSTNKLDIQFMLG